jgi:DNA uptake protein ComE-like DNA-binding protein
LASIVAPALKPAAAVQADTPAKPHHVEPVSPLKTTSKTETQQPTKPDAAIKNSRLVSINSGTEADLCAIEGLSRKLAQSIIKKRPFASLDDLRRIKGMTVKLLATIRSRLSL